VVKYYGHSFFEISLVGADKSQKTVLVDPWAESPLSPLRVKDFEGRKIDYIVVTHDHRDHLGNAADLAKLTGAPVIGVYELAAFLEGQGVKSVGGNIGGPLKIPDLEIVLTPATHSSTRGSPVGVVISGADLRVYHAGDTGLFSEMALIHELYEPDLALLPIGGHYTMGIKEAVKAVKLVKPKVVIPMHYNTFPIIQTDPNKFKQLVERETSANVVLLKPGEEFKYP
ncbi:MAG: metal-dependent hydrolase, partial [Desulfurococcaceae archaeon]